MSLNISRRSLIGRTAAGLTVATVAGGHTVLAQDKPTVGIGSKDFTESIILGEIIAQLLEANDYDVERQLNLGGTVVAHEALVNGDIDTYVEYTGTGLLAILGQELPEREESTEGTATEATPGATPSSGGGIAQTVYDIVAEEYPAQFGVEWLEPWGFNNTYALAMRSDQAEELGVTTISELVEYAPDLVIGAPQETLVREDGIPGLEATYGLEFEDVIGLDPGLMYSAIDTGEVDVITAFATDGRIESLNLTLLEDDLQFYPPYFAAPVVRQELLEESPEVREILNQLSGVIDDSRMTSMNFQADGEGKEIEDVARDFLTEEGLLGAE